MYFEIGGKRIFCDRPDKQWAHKAFDDFYALYNPLLGGKTMWALDIGAACGDSTITMAACLSPESHVIAFEPGRESNPLLRSNMSQNHLYSYEIHDVAASNAEGNIGFISSSDNGGVMQDEFLVLRGKTEPEYFVRTVDTLKYLENVHSAAELALIKFVKIDCEGYDYVILDNLSPLIFANQATVIVEWWPDESITRKLFFAIRKMGYTAYNTQHEIVEAHCYGTSRQTADLILRPSL